MTRQLILTFVVCLFAAESRAETNYIGLQNKCQGTTSPGCCISSVRAMRDGKFEQSTDGKCPSGMKANMYRCEGSLSWCEPDDKADIAVNGGGIGNFKKTAKENKDKEKVEVEEKAKEEEEALKKKK